MSSLDLYTLNKAVEVLERPTTFFLNRFFTEIQDPQSKKITVDIRRRRNKIAPFVSPCVEGVPIAALGFESISLDPAYIRLKDAPSQCSTHKRRFGERPDAQMSSAQRLNEDTMDVLNQHEEAIQQRLEWMAAQALVSGSYLVESDHHPSYQVDFRRSPNNTVTIATPWATAGVVDAAATPLQDIETLSEAVYKGTQLTMTDIIMRSSVWRILSKHQDFNDQYERYHGVDSSKLPNLHPQAAATVQFKGMLGDFNIWVYNGSYDLDGVDTPLIPEGMVIGVAAGGLQGFVGHGEIQNDKATSAGLATRTRFVDQFFDDNVGKLFAQTEAAPLVVPGNPDAVAVMTVLA